MSSSFASRRKARKVGGDDEDDSSGQGEHYVWNRKRTVLTIER